MKIICHMGLPKTGTTSLQNAFFSAREKLLEHGVYYPDGGAARENHKLLTALYKPASEVTNGAKYLFDHNVERMQRAAASMWDTIRREVEQKKPKLLVLSSEFFFIFTTQPQFETFHRMMAELSDDITPVLYVREAAALYASSCQQHIKNGRSLEPFGLMRLESGMPLAEAAFGRRIEVCTTDRDKLVDGDVLADFLARFVTPVVGQVPISPVRLNESISAEVLAILDRYRKLQHPQPVHGMMHDHFNLRQILARIEAKGARSPSPKLRPEFAKAVQRVSLDMLWLRDQYGIEFTGVDYGAIDGAQPEIDPTKASVEDLFEVDVERRDRLHAAAMAEALAGWRGLDRMPKFARAVGAAGGGLISRLRRVGA